MAKVDIRVVREKCNVMNDAWFEGAKTVDFNGITQTQFQTDIDAAAANDAAIADLEAELKIKREPRNGKYIALNDKRSKVGLGVAGSAAYGNDSQLYGSMGFVRKSECSSASPEKQNRQPATEAKSKQSRFSS